MVKTTLYLPETVKAGIERLAHDGGISEAQFIRDSLEKAVADARPRPRFGVVEGQLDGPPIDWNSNDHLEGFGE